MVKQISSHPRHTANRRTRSNNGNGNTANAATGATENAAAASHKAEQAEGTRIATLTAETPGADHNTAKRIGHFLTAQTEKERDRVELKARLMGTARQVLAEAATYWAMGDAKAKEAAEVAVRGAAPLYQARSAGLITADELSAALGDVFGYKLKGDGKPSKTPFGQGEVIRKRLVRAVAAKEFIETGDGGRFFVGVPKDAVGPIVERLDANDLSIWQAYDRLAEIKREAAAGRIDPALNPKVMAGIVERLGQPDARDAIMGHPALIPIYSALLDQLLVLDGQKEMTEAAAAMKAAEKAAKAAASKPRAMAA